MDIAFADMFPGLPLNDGMPDRMLASAVRRDALQAAAAAPPPISDPMRTSVAERYPTGSVCTYFTTAFQRDIHENASRAVANTTMRLLAKALTPRYLKAFGDSFGNALECAVVSIAASPVVHFTARKQQVLCNALETTTKLHMFVALCADELRGRSLLEQELVSREMRSEVTAVVSDIRKALHGDTALQRLADNEWLFRRTIGPLTVLVYGEPLLLSPLESLMLVARVYSAVESPWREMVHAHQRLVDLPAGFQLALQYAHSHQVQLCTSLSRYYGDSEWIRELYWAQDNTEAARKLALPVYSVSASYARLRRMQTHRQSRNGVHTVRETNAILSALRGYTAHTLEHWSQRFVADSGALDRCVDVILMLLAPCALVDAKTRMRTRDSEWILSLCALYNAHQAVLFGKLAAIAEQARLTLCDVPCDRVLEAFIDHALRNTTNAQIIADADETVRSAQRFPVFVSVTARVISPIVGAPMTLVADDDDNTDDDGDHRKRADEDDFDTLVANAPHGIALLDDSEKSARMELYNSSVEDTREYTLQSVGAVLGPYALQRRVYVAMEACVRRMHIVADRQLAMSWALPTSPLANHTLSIRFTGAPASSTVLFDELAHYSDDAPPSSLLATRTYSVLGGQLQVNGCNENVTFAMCTHTLQQALRIVECCDDSVKPAAAAVAVSNDVAALLPLYPLVVRELLAHLRSSPRSELGLRRSETIGCALRAFLSAGSEPDRSRELYSAGECAVYARVLSAVFFRTRDEAQRSAFENSELLQSALFSMVSRACHVDAQRYHALPLCTLRDIVVPQLSELMSRFVATPEAAMVMCEACSVRREDIAYALQHLQAILQLHESDDDAAATTEDTDYIPLIGHSHEARKLLHPTSSGARREYKKRIRDSGAAAASSSSTRPAYNARVMADADTRLSRLLYRLLMGAARAFEGDATARVFFEMRCITLEPRVTRANWRFTRLPVRRLRFLGAQRRAAPLMNEATAMLYYTSPAHVTALSEPELFTLTRPNYTECVDTMQGGEYLRVWLSNARRMFRTLEATSRNLALSDEHNGIEGDEVFFDALPALLRDEGSARDAPIATPLLCVGGRVHHLETLLAVAKVDPVIDHDALLCERRGAFFHRVYHQHRMVVNTRDFNEATLATAVSTSAALYRDNTVLGSAMYNAVQMELEEHCAQPKH